MNPIRRFFARLSNFGRTSVSTLFATRTGSGVSVSSDTALQSDAVYACVRYPAQTVGQLPWYAYKAKASGGADALASAQFDQINSILNSRVNPYLSSQRFREIMVSHALLYGNGVAEIERQGSGRAMALYPLDPANLKFESPDGQSVEYVYKDDRRGEVRFQAQDVFHIANFGSVNELSPIGKSVIEYAAESIGWQRATELFGAAYFNNGVHPSGMITMKNALSPEAYKIFEQTLKTKFNGSTGAHQPFITDGEASFVRFGIQANEAQFIESMQHQVEQIARWFGVPPSKVGHLLHAGVRANVEHASIEVIQDCIMPWVRRFEIEADAKLFREGEKYFTRMDLSALLRGDNQARAEFYSKMLDKGVFSVNEVREMEDMNPIGPEGDQHLVQGQYMPLTDVSAAARQALLPAPEPKEDNNDQPSNRKPKLIAAPVRDGAADYEFSADPIDADEVSDEEEWGGLRRNLNL